MRPNSTRLRPLIDRYLKMCFSRQTPPHVAELAQRLGMSRFTALARFRREERITIRTYFLRRRIEHAQNLLRTTQLPIVVIARLAAFKTQRSFDRAFERATGTTPRAYRRRSEGSQTAHLQSGSE